MRDATDPTPCSTPYSGAEVIVTTTAEHTTVAVAGELDLTVIDRLQARLTEELQLQPAALIIDLACVEFCSCGGLAVLLHAVTTAHDAGIPCAIVAASRPVLRPVRLLNLDRNLPIHPDRADVEQWLSLLARLR
ncbi:STAS domain-containing protein [Amycolatopsis sp. CA-128772]|uniref:STAS domain-containing protein n=1 Tax=Amycolatopsis sp. CA-128772 TaxID=2073159 RepID=UPI000CD07419|nr:STAS domain-containing protein [Amycolatopsis sp. CA-128772]